MKMGVIVKSLGVFKLQVTRQRERDGIQERENMCKVMEMRIAQIWRLIRRDTVCKCKWKHFGW